MDDEKDQTLEGQTDDDTATGEGEATGEESKAADDSKKGKSDDKKNLHTDEEVDAIIEKRLARERAKMAKEIRQEILDEQKNEQSEAEKLKNMTELQKAQYEAKKIKEENEALMSKISLSEQTTIARTELEAAGIHLGDKLLAMFVSDDAEKTNEAIEQLKVLWPEALNEAVQQKLKRKLPPADRGNGHKSYGAEFAEKYSNSKFKNGGDE